MQNPSMPLQRVKLAVVTLPAKLDLTLDQVTNENHIRQYCAQKGMTLPGQIYVEAEAVPTGWYVTVWERRDSRPSERR